jgi:hypothetical protein
MQPTINQKGRELTRPTLTIILTTIALIFAFVGVGAAGETVQVELKLTEGGTTVFEGQLFDVELHCSNISNDEPAFSCFTDLAYDTSFFQFESISHSAEYENYRQGVNNAGVVDALGAVAKVSVSGNNFVLPTSTLVARVRFRALQTGSSTITPSADSGVFTETTLYDPTLNVEGDQRDNALYTALQLTVEERVCLPQSVGLRSGNTFYLKYNLTSGNADETVAYGRTTDEPFVGDWDGDTDDTPGLRRENQFFLKNTNVGNVHDISFRYGRTTDEILTSDWDGNGTSTIGLRRGNIFYLLNNLTGPAHDISFAFGRSTDEVITGDWDGDGDDTIGLRRGNIFYLINTAAGGPHDVSFAYGRSSDLVVVGDWNGDCVDTIGLYRPDNGVWYLKNANDTAAHDLSLFFRPTETGTPVTGTWEQGVTPAAESVSVTASDVVNVTSVCAGQWEIGNPTTETIAGTWLAYDGIGDFVSSPFVLEPGSTTNLATPLDTTGLTLDFGGGDTLYTEATMATCE